jgi:protein-S-isoprenylcysteine O-methyltransferase Ste14
MQAWDRVVTPKALVTTGVYAQIQHPIYTSYMVSVCVCMRVCVCLQDIQFSVLHDARYMGDLKCFLFRLPA